MNTRYEVQTYTIIDGWINVWTIDDVPVTFSSKARAQRELYEFFRDLPDQMADCYSPEDYRVVKVGAS